MPSRLALAPLVLLAACPSKQPESRTEPPPPAAADAAVAGAPAVLPGGEVVLPPAPPVPLPPAGLPPLPTDHAPSPDEVALGELLFFDARLAVDGTTSCATCHDPAHAFAGTAVRSQTAGGKAHLRHTPSLVNLAWHPDLGWDGRGADRAGFVAVHAAGQLGQPIDRGLARLLGSPTYRAHLARAAGGRSGGATAAAALLAYAITRFSGDAPWDAHERGGGDVRLAGVDAGYALFNGKARCAACHTPPLYTDLGYHRLGLIASPDDGRGQVDPSAVGAFKTPTLRAAARRAPYFHDGSAATLEAAIDWHLAGGRGQGADPSMIDPMLAAVELTADERAALLAFVRALTPGAAPVVAPTLPTDVPGARP